MDEFGRSISTGFQLYLFVGFVTGFAYIGTMLAKLAVDAAGAPIDDMWWAGLFAGLCCWGMGAAREGIISIARSEDEN